MFFGTSFFFWLIAALGTLVLPWHMQQDGLTLAGLFALGRGEAEAASALSQATQFGRFWFWPVIAGLLLALPGALPTGERARRARFLVWGGGLGLAALVLQGLAVGIQGWNWPVLARLFGELEDRQFGIGLGGALAFAGFLILLTDGLALRGYLKGDRFVSGAVGLLVASIVVFTAWPVGTVLSEMFTPRADLTLGAAMAERLFDSKIWGLGCVTGRVNCGVFWNTLLLAVSTATAATTLGLCFALIVTRSGFRAKKLLRLLTVLPIITPPFVIGLGLILIFGRSGVFNQIAESLFGLELGRWIYGFNGVMLAQVFSFTPIAFLVLIGVVEGVSPAMEEASQTLRASQMRTFRAVTLPLMLPGLANAWLVVFVESLADFGNPIVLGGSFGVLSTEIFFAVVGAQQDFGRAAVLAAVMLVVALTAFIIQRSVVGKRSYVSMTGKGDVGLPTKLPPPVRRVAFAIAIPWAILTVIVYVMALAGAFVRVWGRDWTPTFSHFERAFALEWSPAGALIFSGGAWHSLFTTIQLAAIAAPITAGLGLLASWVLTRQRFAGRTALEFALMLTFAVPGTVIGVAYILTYNLPPLEITGTAVILVACFVFRNLPVGVRSGVAAMSQLDKSLDEAAVTLRASTFRTLRTVVLPLLKPAIVTALVYSFVRAMTTVSAVIFLVSAEYEMATVFIINRVINGDYGLAIAYCAVLIVLMMAAIGLINLLVGRRNLGRRAAAIPTPAPVGGRA
ncbi:MULTISPECIES: ABC transporter permease [Roseomonadaceae]|uniref:Iron ABC transporter permease n=1 Tax=Falsiroseomonas oleicola TaxID=2801474 RepID=A0ABS6H7X3_9PROT|nr:iron ABC transporter permease [Roseomonas oleicola]MBU8544802.1 iron ABC transporter permease [Roseomonas oleicola]